MMPSFLQSILVAMSGQMWLGILVALVLTGGALWGWLGLRRRTTAERSAQDALWKGILESQEQERRRIAGDLHDSLGQNILIIRNRALLGLEQPNRPEAVAEQFNEIIKTSSLALEEVRRTVHNLSTHHIKQLGLTQALDAMIDRIAVSAGLRVERRLESVDGIFSPESAVLCYRIVQEALNNVVKHAGASVVRIALIADVHHVELSVEDDGRGFDGSARQPQAGGMGLVEMERRARLLGGEMNVRCQPGHGTQLRVTAPLKANGKI